MSNPYKPIPVTDHELEYLIKHNPDSYKKLLNFIDYWTKARQRGIVNKNKIPDFGKTPEGIWTGIWHRKLKNTDIEFMTAVLRYKHMNTETEFSQYELDFIQGIEDLARSGKKRNNKQGWQLGMILEEKIV